MTFDSAMTYRDGKIGGGLPAGPFELWAGRRSCNLPDDCGVYWAKSIPVNIEW